jgi:predicted nucleic acid-binding protein
VIVLDTNIVSVLMAKDAHEDDQAVLDWLDTRVPSEVFVTVVTRAEIAYGVSALPDGKRKQTLGLAAAEFFKAMEPHTLPFGISEADKYGQIVAARKRAGRPISILDAQIAAIASCASAALATRDVSGFEGVGLRLVNPYDRKT